MGKAPDNTGSRVVFMGTPEFAAASMEAIAASNHQLVGCVTVPDKPSGRGQKINQSAVKKSAIHLGIPVLQPEKLRNQEFLDELRAMKADVFVVVAFRMLPEVVWAMPHKGTFNLHASLLPEYRGAAPINWAVINGEKRSGVTTFLINHQIDTGHILLQEEMPIDKQDNAGDLHDKLMVQGANLVIKTLNGLHSGVLKPVPQPVRAELKMAPKIFREDCQINFNLPAETVYNFIRGLAPYPAAWVKLGLEEGTLGAKIFSSQVLEERTLEMGKIEVKADKLLIGTADNDLEIIELQPEGKRRVKTVDFLRGFRKNFTKVQD